ncbi:hypothetical protein H0I29_08695 [Polaribacter sp. R2A056_3_33]|uniref:hypothetical protein n=1 Tax=Polaribacter sp. R2A056_3_33 TaxID=2745563 RepID=UPI001C4FEEC8|nr:hypothetical protein [Polaribacter sp. R2A056_3_33]QXP72125.1 hypothetical protein H0I29_08695 [Polaribacter sp. R2A056_3_33]
MKDYNALNNKFVQNGLVIIQSLSTEISRFKIDRITDKFLLKFLDYVLSELDKVKIAIENNPRFIWVQIQEEIDRLYALDKSITGITVQLDWKQGGNRAFYKLEIHRGK